MHVSLSQSSLAFDDLCGACLFVCAPVLSLLMEQVVFQVQCWVSVSTECLSLCVSGSSFLFCVRSSHGSLQGLDIQTAEAEEDRSSISSEALDHSNILAYLSGAGSSHRQSQQTPERSALWYSSPHKSAECDLIGSSLWFSITCLLLNNAWLILVIGCVTLSQCNYKFAHCMRFKASNRKHVM